MLLQRKPEDEAVSADDAKKARTEEPAKTESVTNGTAEESEVSKTEKSASKMEKKEVQEEKMDCQDEVNIICIFLNFVVQYFYTGYSHLSF